ncbi:cytochrome P450 [Leucogyrophana mollusca]|uniref:Cytochrome P450 n=1 Tax=Leucogyrophana mollusca TaxID=85980 RepID=A0ACB8BTW9_9AGAM|nr:cytochrome P450 [Leucogyrophana mollusca]
MPWPTDIHAGSVLVFFVTLGFLVRATKWRKQHPTAAPLPGPTPLPILGNVLGMNAKEPWVTYAEWGTVYGDIFITRLLGRDYVIVNSEAIATELLDERSHNYSDRPLIATRLPFGWDFSFVFAPYGPEWRARRRLFHQAFRADAALEYRPMQLRRSRMLLLDLLESPQRYAMHIQRLTTSTVMSAVYDYEMASHGDPLVAVVERAIDFGVRFLTIEKSALVETFPFLLRLPTWFPGTLKRDAKVSREYAAEMVVKPFQYVLHQMEAGTAAPSMVSNALGKLSGKCESGRAAMDIKEAAGAAFAAATETTASTLLVFVLAMVLNPRVQERAQADIDRVVRRGQDSRLPNFNDRPSLPYVDAILRETLRWHPVAPLGVPHAATDSDVYNGFFIPKGASIVFNTWAMSQNAVKYPNPSEFIPERFLNDDGMLNDDTIGFGFGFGRRICPGRYTADASLWSAMVSMLATFRFLKASDADGNPIKFEPRFTNGLSSSPLPFPLKIVPRSSTLTGEQLSLLL